MDGGRTKRRGHRSERPPCPHHPSTHPVTSSIRERHMYRSRRSRRLPTRTSATPQTPNRHRREQWPRSPHLERCHARAVDVVQGSGGGGRPSPTRRPPTSPKQPLRPYPTHTDGRDARSPYLGSLITRSPAAPDRAAVTASVPLTPEGTPLRSPRIYAESRLLLPILSRHASTVGLPPRWAKQPQIHSVTSLRSRSEQPSRPRHPRTQMRLLGYGAFSLRYRMARTPHPLHTWQTTNLRQTSDRERTHASISSSEPEPVEKA
ncbi:hypothetical protein SAMN04487848_0471 [Microbacterium sp. ru370.1]|nr:hypothetical protein SAMN04487848_0471 [Microbacterium sp. ru370.1]SIT77285.1 hypothetical protein SAMN05880579_0466 [Microbacterium sp. RU1D]